MNWYLNYAPDWSPGAKFKHLSCFASPHYLILGPVDFVRKNNSKAKQGAQYNIRGRQSYPPATCCCSSLAHFFDKLVTDCLALEKSNPM